MEEEKANANSELRYLALELTKLAASQKKPFSAVAGEYVQNVHDLQSILQMGSSAARSANRDGAVNSQRNKKR
ncbi:MAG: hypothetical protein V1822_00425 [Candidatus Micrarchaeota archaeon]